MLPGAGAGQGGSYAQALGTEAVVKDHIWSAGIGVAISEAFKHLISRGNGTPPEARAENSASLAAEETFTR